MTHPAHPRSRILPAALLLLGVGVTLALSACSAEPAHASGGDPVRGRYLVEQVGLCIDCHSPRDEQGRFVAERWLQGSLLPFAPTAPMPWANAAPNLAGLPSLTDSQALTFLTTGELPGGRRPRPPMPEYRFSPTDARDVIAYLRAPVAPLGSVAPAK